MRRDPRAYLWDGREAARRDQDLAAIARYLVATPLRAGLVRNLRYYPLWDAIWL